MHPGFIKNSSAVMTCKEGRNRGHVYEFNTIFVTRSNLPSINSSVIVITIITLINLIDKDVGKAHTQFTSWDLEGEVTTTNEEWIEPSAAGIQAVFHNRNVSDPVMIALRDDEVRTMG